MVEKILRDWNITKIKINLFLLCFFHIYLSCLEVIFDEVKIEMSFISKTMFVEKYSLGLLYSFYYNESCSSCEYIYGFMCFDSYKWTPVC